MAGKRIPVSKLPMSARAAWRVWRSGSRAWPLLKLFLSDVVWAITGYNHAWAQIERKYGRDLLSTPE